MGSRRDARVEDDELTVPGGELLPRATPLDSGFAPRRDSQPDSRPSEIPTRQMEDGVAGFASRIDEIRRLYAAGATEEALLLASTVTPAAPAGWSLTSVPVLTRPIDEIVKMPLDHRAGFFLTHVDGHADLETILDLVPLPEAEVLALVESLVALGVILLEPSHRIPK